MADKIADHFSYYLGIFLTLSELSFSRWILNIIDHFNQLWKETCTFDRDWENLFFFFFKFQILVKWTVLTNYNQKALIWLLQLEFIQWLSLQLLKKQHVFNYVRNPRAVGVFCFEIKKCCFSWFWFLFFYYYYYYFLKPSPVSL